MTQNNKFYDLPKTEKTETISYYDVETDQNLTAEEWNKLYPNSSEIKLINQGEVYQSWKAFVDNAPYGPMEFSNNIVSQSRSDYPKVSSLLEYNRNGTVNFLKANNALQAYELNHFFCVSKVSDNEFRVWTDYRNGIENYLSEFTRRDLANNWEKLQTFRKVLADHIQNKHYQKFPNWPSVGCENTASIELDVNDSYTYGDNYVKWDCNGSITVKVQRINYNKFKVEFSGSPKVKLLVFDSDGLKRIEGLFSSRSIEEIKSHIDRQSR